MTLTTTKVPLLDVVVETDFEEMPRRPSNILQTDPLSCTDDGPLDDPVFGFQRLWLKRPPLQLDLDTALRISAPFQGLDTLDLESYTVFSATLFREMALSGLRHRWFLFVPAGAATGITLHTVLRRIPGVGEFVGPLASTAVIGSAVGAALALQA